MTFLPALLLLVLITFAAFLAASEVALFSLSRFQLRAIKERFRGSYRTIRMLLQDPGGLLITLLVLLEVTNISISTVIAESFAAEGSTDPTQWLIQTLKSTLISSMVLLFFCEVTPKAIAVRGNQLIAPLTARILYAIYRLMKPLRWALKTLFSPFLHDSHGSGDTTHSPQRQEQEILTLLEQGQKEGSIERTEVEWIRNVFELDDERVQSLLTPLSEVITLPNTLTVAQALKRIQSVPYSRIPVTEGNTAAIVGVLYTRDLMLAKLSPESEKKHITTFLRKPIRLSPQTSLHTAFRRLKQQRVHLAVVEQVPGQTIGILTMNDLLDALFEDILEAPKK